MDESEPDCHRGLGGEDIPVVEKILYDGVWIIKKVILQKLLLNWINGVGFNT
jgi:hypothetical protein